MPSQKKFLGLKKVADPSSTLKGAIDVVFVHGLTGDSERTWNHPDGCYWPRDLLPHDLPNSRIFSYGYDADIVHFFGQTSQSRLNDHANTFLSALANQRIRTETERRPLIFVAHSLGGLVVEDLLLASKNSAEDHLKQVLESTFAIAFMGTPFCGSHLAAWGGVLSGFTNLLKKSNVPLIQVLKPDSEVLARLQQEFHSMIRDRGKQGLPMPEITCFFEDLPYQGVGFIVPSHSAILPGRTPIGIPYNHVDMARYADDQDPGYQAVLGELWRWSRDADRASQAAAANGGQRFDLDHIIDPGNRTEVGALQQRALMPADEPSFQSTANSFQGAASQSGKIFQGSTLYSQGDMHF